MALPPWVYVAGHSVRAGCFSLAAAAFLRALREELAGPGLGWKAALLGVAMASSVFLAMRALRDLRRAYRHTG